ncbi:MAG: hypothetical protein ACI9P5_000885 [Saprospiraceae bacterium]|jgi:hypothetical protein|tara:strand:- start:689 stop:1447 length:759 start_codon:yes stop_codon:yes gene_type:complete
MIKFFRKIRKNLLSEGKTGKYLKYAFGEIMLVVIGILFALQINNWNNNKNEKEEIENYYFKIHEEITITQERFNLFKATLDTLNQHNNRSLDIINLKNRDSLYLLKETLGALGTAYKSNFLFPIINEFLNEGYLAKINNDSLKLGFQYFSMELNALNSLDEYIYNQYSTSIEPYFYNTINYAEVVHGGADLNELKTGGPSTNYEQFYDNLELWNLLTFKVETTISQQRLIDILYRTLEFIDEKIQEKLNNKD